MILQISRERVFYKFTDSIEEEETEGLFTEVPITSYYRFIFYKLADRIFRRFSSKMVVLADGTHFRKADQIKSGWHIFLIRPCLTPLVCPL